jgi:hypothetical protein
MTERLEVSKTIEDVTGERTGQRALLILGGLSGQHWKETAREINPDFLLGVNGVNAVIPDLDYWLCIENMRATFSRARKHKDPRYMAIVEMFLRLGPKIRFVNRNSVHLLKDLNNVITVNRGYGLPVERLPEDFSLRKFGKGLLNGPASKRGVDVAKIGIGTVALQAFHLAGILGAAEIHTIGFDLCFGKTQHWYEYPETYKPGRYFGEKSFVQYMDLKTTWQWVDTAEYMRSLKPLMETAGITWVDHSDGLLQRMKVI